MSTTTTKAVSYKRFFKGKDRSISQLLPLPVVQHEQLVGMQQVKCNLVDIINLIPDYSPFRDAEGYYFDLDEMDKLVNFIVNECIFPEGENAGLPFIPEKWQWAVFLNMFCWKSNKTNRRRYREVLVYVPRKNGKTSAFGVIPTLYMMFVDKEQRSQNYCCAADVEQASVNFRHVVYNIEKNPRLLNRLVNRRVNKSTKYFEHNDGSMFKVLSSIAETKHGLSPNFVYIDEVHAHKSSELIDVMVTGTAGRSQPITMYTTTADYDRLSVCNDIYARAKNVALGINIDPKFLPVIYEALPEDDFTALSTWKKANPNFGVSIYPEYFERQISLCHSNPALLNRFLRLHLNIKTKTETVWIPPWVWANGTEVQNPQLTISEIVDKLKQFKSWHNYFDSLSFKLSKTDTSSIYLNDFRNYYTWYFKKLEELRHEECWGGYDNSASSDIASYALFFPNARCGLNWYWVPAESIERRSKEERLPYDRWYKSGLINNTPMACISEINIANTLVGENGICNYFSNIQLTSYDRWGSNYIEEMMYNMGINARPYAQNFAYMTEPTRKLESMVTNKEFFHGGNPVTDWMNNNCMLQLNNSNQQRIDKAKSSGKVDGMVALATAIGGYIYTENNTINSLPGLHDDV